MFRLKLTLNAMYSNVWAADIFDTAHMTFLFLVVHCCKCTKSKNNTSILPITYFCTME